MKVYNMKYLSKLGLLSEGACATTVLILVNASFSMSVHLNCTLCLTICCKGLTICAKSGKPLHKVNSPHEILHAFLIVGQGDLCYSFNPFWFYRDSPFRNDVTQ